jgi:hypothetical protein
MVEEEDVTSELQIFVKDTFNDSVDPANRRWFPTSKTVRDHIRLAEKAIGSSDNDQERVAKLVSFLPANKCIFSSPVTQ